MTHYPNTSNPKLKTPNCKAPKTLQNPNSQISKPHTNNKESEASISVESSTNASVINGRVQLLGPDDENISNNDLTLIKKTRDISEERIPNESIVDPSNEQWAKNFKLAGLESESD